MKRCLDFFELAITDTSRVFTTRGDFEFLISPSCEDGVSVYRVPYQCISCLIKQRILDEKMCQLSDNCQLHN